MQVERSHLAVHAQPEYAPKVGATSDHAALQAKLMPTGDAALLADPTPVATPQACSVDLVQRRRREESMCSCRRRSGWSDGGWRCVSDIVVVTEPVWSDDFDNDVSDRRLNSTKWGHIIGPNPSNNNELQYYTDRPGNVRVGGGVLTIIAKRDGYKDMNYTSASVKTRGLGDWGPGHRVEVRAKLPVGVGTSPAIRMLPTDNAYGGWLDSGQIDIMEAFGHSPNKIFGSVHTGAYNHMNVTHKGIYFNTSLAQWHTYSIDWEETQIKWYVDGDQYNSFAPDTNDSSKWPFDQRFHLIITLAIGGTSGGSVGFGSDDQIMEIDYVRVYCLDGGQSCRTQPFSCCSECKFYMPFCSPLSKKCYTSKSKDYHQSCPLPVLAETGSVRSGSAMKVE
jgi:beta-glucanase (GH16 family)